MPSVRAIMLGLVALVPLVSAAPAVELADLGTRAVDCFPFKAPIGPAPAQPLTDGATQLPKSNLTLVAVGLGRGTQNYTCSAVGAAPASNGAAATLFDATALAYASTSLLNTIPAMAVYAPLPQGNFYMAAGHLPVLGKHYFDSALTPTFDLKSLNRILYAGKVANVKAPATANKGPAGTGAVDWLYLHAKSAPYASVGLAEVYRLVTAGGVAPPCTAVGSMTVEYAAEYWFYD